MSKYETTNLKKASKFGGQLEKITTHIFEVQEENSCLSYENKLMAKFIEKHLNIKQQDIIEHIENKAIVQKVIETRKTIEYNREKRAKKLLHSTAYRLIQNLCDFRQLEDSNTGEYCYIPFPQIKKCGITKPTHTFALIGDRECLFYEDGSILMISERNGQEVWEHEILLNTKLTIKEGK